MAEPLASQQVILSVIGPHSGCGKSSLVVQLLHRIKGLGCLKISPVHDHGKKPPSGREATGQDYWLEDPASLHSAGKDSALYLAAGAVQVERLSHRRGRLALGLDAALRRFPQGMPVVVESSAAVRLLKPVAVLMVVRSPVREMKPATADVLSFVTDLLVNVSAEGELADAEGRRLQYDFPTLRPRYVWVANLISQPLPDDLFARLRGLLGPL